MLQGTSSDVGKSVLCTALCRIFSHRGLKVAPFKSQNMSNNSYVTSDGGEIGRAQGIQAEAAKIEASVFMNPILLKPSSDNFSEVIVLGKSSHSYSGREYRQHFYETGLKTIKQATEKLSEQFDYLIVEGAGSPVEINLNDRELVNMRVAKMVDLPVILVADIDRGGVFASIVGTLQLLSDEERNRVVGVIINKFRGDISLFHSGLKWLEEYTGKRILGVVPFIDEIGIEAEDSLAIGQMRKVIKPSSQIDIAVIKLPYVSNFTDLEPFCYECDVSIRFVERAEDLGKPDALIIPGTKSTIHDLQFLRQKGLDQAIVAYVKNGGRVFGICGGYQILGREIIDEAGTDTGVEKCKQAGLNILPITTVFGKEKLVKRSKGTIYNSQISVEGYEIHLGETIHHKIEGSFSPFIQYDNHQFDGLCDSSGRIIGTYFHHLFHNDEWRSYWLNQIRVENNITIADPVTSLDYQQKKQIAYDRLAKTVEEYVDINAIIDSIDQWGERS